MKRILPIIALILLVYILNLGFSSKSAEKRGFEFSLDGNLEGLAAAGFLALKSQVNEGAKVLASGERAYARAIEIREGGSGSFEELSVTLVSIEEVTSCTDDCLRARLAVSFGGREETVSSAVGEILSFEDYTVKVSQIAPTEMREGVLRRAVLLFSKE